MRISDWSSDVCSSDLLGPRDVVGTEHRDDGDLTGTLAQGFTVTAAGMPVPGTLQFGSASAAVSEDIGHVTISVTRSGGSDGAVGVKYATADGSAQARSEERRAGKEGVSTGRLRGCTEL